MLKIDKSSTISRRVSELFFTIIDISRYLKSEVKSSVKTLNVKEFSQKPFISFIKSHHFLQPFLLSSQLANC